MTQDDSRAGEPAWSAHVSAGVRVSSLSVAWTVVASTIAVALGVANHTLVLVVFGATGLLDAAGSLALVFHFRHALKHLAISESRERFALRLVGIGLVAVGVSTIAESARRLATGEASGRSAAGVAVASASAVVLTGLTVWKRRVATRLSSGALIADSWLSATGALLAAITLAGTSLSTGAGRHWIDPAAALAVAVLAAGVGVSELRREERSLDDDPP